jgi:D-glycero-alpha-D-manno-heptose-7-phosphate kinase
VKALPLPGDKLRELSGRLHLFFTGKTRQADAILSEQARSTGDRLAELDALKQLALELEPALEANDFDRLGKVLHANWELKRKLASGISNAGIEEMYARSRASGALGGKICGAGGGGFLLVYCAPDRQEGLAKGMREYRVLPFQLERDGSKVIFNYRREVWK